LQKFALFDTGLAKGEQKGPWPT